MSHNRTPEFNGALEHAIIDLRDHVLDSVSRKGLPNWSPHTALGVLAEESFEFLTAVHANDGAAQAKELLDIANAALLGLHVQPDADAGRWPKDGRRTMIVSHVVQILFKGVGWIDARLAPTHEQAVRECHRMKLTDTVRLVVRVNFA